MEANIAVATLSGRAYYLIVNELRKKNIPFLSLIPNQLVPMEIKVVITTDAEKHLVKHARIIPYKEIEGLETVIGNVLQIAYGKEYYERLVIGIDPGEVIGLAVVADGKVVETENCFSVAETLKKIENILKSNESTPMAPVSIKIGDGAITIKEQIILALSKALPQNIVLECVSEAGTSRNLVGTKHRRGLRDMASAIRIAGRKGQSLQRRRVHESDS
jgi:hypothetical protein